MRQHRRVGVRCPAAVYPITGVLLPWRDCLEAAIFARPLLPAERFTLRVRLLLAISGFLWLWPARKSYCHHQSPAEAERRWRGDSNPAVSAAHHRRQTRAPGRKVRMDLRWAGEKSRARLRCARDTQHPDQCAHTPSGHPSITDLAGLL